MRILRLAFAFALALAPTLADAQQFPAVPSQTVIGRTAYGPGPAQAIPFSSLISTLLSSAPNIPTINTNSIVFKGSTSGQATVQAQAVAGTATLLLPTVSGTIPSTATPPIQIDATGNISCPSCATSTSAASPVIASRALGQTLNLSSFSGLITAGYAAAGDGGGAYFQKISSSNNFLDSNIATGTCDSGGGCTITTAGSGCPAGPLFGVNLSGGSGSGAPGSGSIAQGIASISSGALSSFTITGTGGNAYRVGDVLTVQAGCATEPTITVTAVTAPLGSFTDSVGTKFQIISARIGNINVRQFGAVGNYTEAGGEGAATDDSGPIQAALRYAAAGNGTTDAGGNTGAMVLAPTGGYLVCNGLQVPQGVTFTGAGQSATTLKQCTSDGLSSNFITLGDPQNHQTAFFANIWNMTLFGGSNGSVGSGAMIFSNSDQSGDAVNNVAIYSTVRGGIKYTIGYGGTSIFRIHAVYDVPNSTLSPFGFQLDGSGFVIDGGTWFSVGGAQWGNGPITSPAIAILNGTFSAHIDGIHCENLYICVSFTNNGSSPSTVEIDNAIGNAALENFLQVVGSTPNNAVIMTFNANGTACSVIRVTTCVATGNIIAPTAF